MRAHFDTEKGIFCNAETYGNREEHSKEHETFHEKLFSWKVLIAADDAEWFNTFRYTFQDLMMSMLISLMVSESQLKNQAY